MKKRVLSLVLAGATVLSLTAYGSNIIETASAAAVDGKEYKIGVLQLVQHTALDAIYKGFEDALKDAGINYKLDYQNASGELSDCQTIAAKLVTDQNDLILAITTPAAQAVAGVTNDIPIVVTAVINPAASGLVASNEAPGGNVTGTSDRAPVKEQIELLQKLIPEVKTVGILYNSANQYSGMQAQMAAEALDTLGIAHEDYTVSDFKEIQTIIESMAGKAEAIYAPADDMIAAGMATVSMIATENKIPVICGEAGMVEDGGVAAYDIDYYQLGYMTGEMAVDILVNGKNPADMPIAYLSAEKCKLAINQEMVDALGLDVSLLK